MTQRELLRQQLKEYRIKYGKDSDKVFKVIRQLKSLRLSKDELLRWEYHALNIGSFGGRCNN